MIITMYLTFFIITNLLDFSKHIHTTLLRELQFANVYSNKRNRPQVPYFRLNPNGLHVDLVVLKKMQLAVNICSTCCFCWQPWLRGA